MGNDITWDDEIKWDEQPKEQPKKGGVMSKIVRAVMRNSPLEAMQTESYLLNQNLPRGGTPQEQLSNVQQAVQPYEQQKIGQGVASQLEAPIMAALGIGGAVNPASTLKGLAKFGAMEGVANATGINQAIQNIPNADIRDIADLSKLGLEGALATKSWGLDKLRTRFDVSKNLAQSYFNLKGPEGEVVASSIAKEGIFAKDARSYYKKLTGRKNKLSQELTTQFANATLKGTKVDLNYDNIIKPITDLATSMQEYPELNRPSIRTLNRVWNDIFRNFTKLEEAGDFTPNSVLEFKRKLGEEVPSWDKLPSNVDKRAIVSAMRQVYRNIDNLLDISVPESKLTNTRLSNLIEATDALKAKIAKEPGLLRKLRRFDITRPGTFVSPLMEWTATQSGLSKVFSSKYPSQK